MLDISPNAKAIASMDELDNSLNNGQVVYIAMLDGNGFMQKNDNNEIEVCLKETNNNTIDQFVGNLELAKKFFDSMNHRVAFYIIEEEGDSIEWYFFAKKGRLL